MNRDADVSDLYIALRLLATHLYEEVSTGTQSSLYFRKKLYDYLRDLGITTHCEKFGMIQVKILGDSTTYLEEL